MASEESWKEKYLQELETTENKHRQWQEERTALERMLVRTSLASEGQAPELDRLLAAVRSDLKKKRIDLEAWRKLQEQIDRQIALLDDAPATKATPKASAEITAAPPTEPDLKAPPDLELADKTHRLRIARRVGQLLGQLMQQVTLDTRTESRARELQTTLLSSNDWSILRDGLNQVAELVIEAVSYSKREFERFLKRLDERLELLKRHFTEQSDVQLLRQDDTAALDREIRDELERVGSDLRDSDDLHNLKRSISQRLETIGIALDRFQARESEREQLLARQLEAMQEKVAAMEVNSEQMQAQVRQERQRAMTDLLTQLPNREAWQERLAFEYNRWQRYRHALSVAVLDIDLFKTVNDSYGHKAGDRVLQLVARELSGRLRTTDFIARFGGEEFVLLLPETTAEAALSVIDQLRTHIAGLPFHFGGNPVNVTFSAGLTAFQEDDTEETVFDRADRALYEAKANGRNRTIVC
jgi:diguanylate cyclase